MQSVKDFAAVIGAVFGVLSAVVTFYAKYLDLKKKSSVDRESEDPPVEGSEQLNRPAVRRRSSPNARPIVNDEPRGREVSGVRPAVLLEAVGGGSSAEAIRRTVKPPAVALITAGAIGLVFNLLVGVYGYVDEFVTPLTAETRAHRDAGIPPDQSSAVGATVATFGLSVASAAAIWAGLNMLKLRSYRLSLAGSVAIMPGACLCFFAGIPIGIWSLMVLSRPEVREAFQ